jgi:hypothetical protein
MWAAPRSRRVHARSSQHRPMADFLAVLGVLVFVAAMLGLVWGLDRV